MPRPAPAGRCSRGRSISCRAGNSSFLEARRLGGGRGRPLNTASGARGADRLEGRPGVPTAPCDQIIHAAGCRLTRARLGADPPTRRPCRRAGADKAGNPNETGKLQGSRAGEFRRNAGRSRRGCGRSQAAAPFRGIRSVLDLLREDGLDIARAAVRGVRADFPLRELEFLPPVLAPEKILCVGINYANRNADFGDAEAPKYPSLFYRAPGSLVGHLQPIVRPNESEQFDYEGEIALVIGRAGRRIAPQQALASCRRRNAVQRRHHPRLAAPRQVQCHPGQELRRQRQHRPVDRDHR